MTRRRYTAGDRLAIISLFAVYVLLTIWALSGPRGEGAPVPAVHQGRLG